MAIRAFIQKLCGFNFPEEDIEDVKSLFEKLHNYRKPVGLGKDDGLNLTRRDREIIKQFHSGFDKAEEDQG